MADEPRPEQLADILSWCALLGGCDAASLRELAGARPADLLLLADRGLLLLAPGDRFELPEGEIPRAIEALRAREPRAELERRARAVVHFAERLRQDHAVERECLRHLGALHDLLVEYMEWDSIISYTSAIRNTRAVSARAERWLSFYDAYAALRAGEPAGRERLTALLAEDDLEPALRLRALHAAHIAEIELSRYDQALELLEAALALARAGGDAPRESYVLLSLGQIYNDLDDHARAVEYSRQSLELARQSGAVYREAHALYELGSNLMQLGEWAGAGATLAQAAARYQALGLDRRLAMILWAQGLAHQVAGDDAASERAYQQALAIAGSDSYQYDVVAMDVLKQLGLLYQSQGRDAEALAVFARAIGLAERRDLRHWRPLLLGNQARLLQRAGRAAEALAAYQAAVRGVEEIRSGIAIESIQISLFGTTQQIYEALVLFCLEQGDLAGAFAYAEQARARAFLDLLARRSPELYAAAEHPTATLAEVQARLAPGELLLAYFTAGVPRAEHWLARIPAHNQRLREAVAPVPAVILFAVSRERAEAHALAIDPATLAPSRHTDDPVLAMLRIAGVDRWLYDRLLAPVEPALAQCRQIYLVPHGPLHYIPFAALRRADGRFLLDEGGPALAIAPSATILLRSCLGQAPRHDGGILALGYNGPGDARLEHAEREALAVANLLAGTAMIGDAPKRQLLLDMAPGLRWLHIAGHAIYDHERAYTYGLQLGEGDTLDASAVMRDLKLQADLVTLSSCMSGFGHVVPGDELFGLQRAFLYAGAPAVLCTIAKTYDTVTALVMEQFYTRLRAGAAAGPALRDAIVAVRHMSRDAINAALLRLGYAALPTLLAAPADDRPFDQPEYWAPFVLIGRP